MWWNSITTLQQVMFVIACSVTAILAIQIILMLIGNIGDSDGDFSGAASDASGDVSDFDSDIDINDATSVGDLPSGGGLTDISDTPDIDGEPSTDIQPHSSSSLLPFGLKLISLRSILAFLAIGCWVCYTMIFFVEWYYALIIAVASGFAAACLMAAAILGMERLQSDGNINPNNAAGKTGTVYLTIPPSRSGSGKINVLVQERYAEYEAITDSVEQIPTGTEIKVVSHVGGNVLLVERLKKPNITIVEE